MKYLETYVNEKNRWGSIFGNGPLVIGRDNARIAESIDCELSPENLTCDGEANPTYVRNRYKLLVGAARELKALDPSVRFYEVA